MNEKQEAGITTKEQAQPFEAIRDILRKFSETAGVKAVYGEPVKQGDNLIITCAEVIYGMGFGMGGGTGRKPASPEAEAGEEAGGATGTGAKQGAGFGGGGGGQALSRPVAVVIASPEGVRVEPVIDRTKIALAGLTASGFMLGMIFKMAKACRARA